MFLSQIHVVAGLKIYVPNSLLFGVVWSFCIWFVKAFNHNKEKTGLRSELTATLQYVSLVSLEKVHTDRLWCHIIFVHVSVENICTAIDK